MFRPRAAAEEMRVTAANVATMANGKNPEVRRLLGCDGDYGKYLGLDPRWAARAIHAAGNYGEMFKRNLGALGLARGVNRPWRQGGILNAPPFR